MGFEIVTPGRGGISALERGHAALDTAGNLRLCYGDLLAMKIMSTDAVVLMVDKATNRIALRKAVEGEPPARMKVSKTKTSVTLGVNGCFKLLGREAPKAAVRFPIEVKDNLLIVQVAKPGAK